MASRTRTSTSMSLDPDLLNTARALGINLSRAAEQGLAAAISAERAKRWRDENAGAIEDYNAMIATEGIPLSGHRKF